MAVREEERAARGGGQRTASRIHSWRLPKAPPPSAVRYTEMRVPAWGRSPEIAGGRVGQIGLRAAVTLSRLLVWADGLSGEGTPLATHAGTIQPRGLAW